MNKYVFHDIDDVLLPWDFPNLKWLHEHSGFTDFEKVNHPYMNYVSRELLNLIHEVYGEHIWWLTTWELGAEGANKAFCDTLGLPRYKEIPFIDSYWNNMGQNGLIVPTLKQTYWWKSVILKKFLDELEDQNYKAVWIDDEISNQIKNSNVHEELVSNSNLLKITTVGTITRKQIQEVKEWLEE